MRRSYKGSAVQTTLSGSINNTVTSVPVTDGSSYPDGSAGPFFVVLDRGLVGEEKILVTTRVGNTFTVATRGQDDTTAVAHGAGGTVNHCFTKTDADEANAHVNASAAVHGLAGVVVGTTDAQTLTNKTLTTPVVNGIAVAGVVADLSSVQTVTNKTVNLSSNTVTGTTAQFNTALSDNDFATLVGVETLSNKTLVVPIITAGSLDATSSLGGVTGTTLAADHAAWSSYTPASPGNMTSPNFGVTGLRYIFVGKTLHVTGSLVGGTVTASAGISFELPASAVAASLGGNNAATFPCLQGTALLLGWVVKNQAVVNINKTGAGFTAGDTLNGISFTLVVQVQ